MRQALDILILLEKKTKLSILCSASAANSAYLSFVPINYCVTPAAVMESFQQMLIVYKKKQRKDVFKKELHDRFYISYAQTFGILLTRVYCFMLAMIQTKVTISYST